MTSIINRPLITFVIHCYYPDQLHLIVERMANCLQSSDIKFNVILGYSNVSCAPAAESLGELEATEGYGGYKLFRIKNLGRNFATLLEESVIAEVNGETVLHLHTKKSPHLPRLVGRLWLRLILLYLLPNAAILKLRSRRLVEQGGIAFAPLDLLFRRRSRKKPDSKPFFEKKMNPNEISSQANSRLVRFPAGGMFHADSRIFLSWTKKVLEARPIFRQHDSISGETEHFLERDLGDHFMKMSQKN